MPDRLRWFEAARRPQAFVGEVEPTADLSRFFRQSRVGWTEVAEELAPLFRDELFTPARQELARGA